MAHESSQELAKATRIAPVALESRSVCPRRKQTIRTHQTIYHANVGNALAQNLGESDVAD